MSFRSRGDRSKPTEQVEEGPCSITKHKSVDGTAPPPLSLHCFEIVDHGDEEEECLIEDGEATREYSRVNV